MRKKKNVGVLIISLFFIFTGIYFIVFEAIKNGRNYAFLVGIFHFVVGSWLLIKIIMGKVNAG